jgi:hypothetical protein
MAAQRESSVEESSEWAGISESGDDDMDFEVCLEVVLGACDCFGGKSWEIGFCSARCGS